MPGLYIGSTAPFGGKNTLCMGIGLKFKQEGLKVGYMKPVGAQAVLQDDEWCEADALTLQKALDLDAPQELVNPVLVTQDLMHEILSSPPCEDRTAIIRAAYDKLAAEKQVMVVGGSGSFLNSNRYACLDGPSVSQALELPVLIVDRFGQDVNYEALLSVKFTLGDKLLGCVLNDVPSYAMDEVNSVIIPFLLSRGVMVLGVIPHDRMLGSVSVRDLAERLGAKIICSAHKIDQMAENFIIGAMQVDNFLTHFRKRAKAAIIMGGDRSDLQLVGIENKCPCLILTGNLYPNDIVLSRAENAEVPILVVRDDTYCVAKRVDALLGGHKLRAPAKFQRAAQLVAAHLDLAAIKQGLGL